MAFLISDLSGLLRDILAAGDGELETDLLTFRGTVTQSGDVTQPTNVTLKNTHDYFITRVHSGMTYLAANYADQDLIRWNIQVSGTGKNMFRYDVEMATCSVPGSGEPVPIDFAPGGYAIRAGAELSQTITRRSSLGNATSRIVTTMLAAIVAPKGAIDRYLGRLAGPGQAG